MYPFPGFAHWRLVFPRGEMGWFYHVTRCLAVFCHFDEYWCIILAKVVSCPERDWDGGPVPVTCAQYNNPLLLISMICSCR